MITRIRAKAALCCLLAVMALAGGHHWRATQLLADTRAKVPLEVMFPTTFGAWVVDERRLAQLVSPDQVSLLNKLYSETLSRTYLNKSTGERVMLSVAYGADQREGTRAHLPEVCYPAQGFQLLSKATSSVTANGDVIPVQRLVTQLGSRLEPVTYWVVVGERIALTSPQQKWAQLQYSTAGYIPDGMLVRVSNIDADPAKSYRLHEDFVSALAAAFSPDLKRRAFGTTAS